MEAGGGRVTSSSRMELQEWLRNENEVAMEFRLNRLEYIVEAYAQLGEFDRLGFPGEISLRLFEEIRWCFVNGQDMSCVMAVQGFIEAGLSSLLAMSALASDRWLKSATFAPLIDKCLDEGLISHEDATAYHKLRRLRVQYVHPKPVFSKKHISRRMLEEGKYPSELAEDDAYFAQGVLFDYMTKHLWRSCLLNKGGEK